MTEKHHIRLHVQYSPPEDEHMMFETCRRQEELISNFRRVLSVGRDPSQLVSVLWPAPLPPTLFLLPNGSGHFRAKLFPV